MLSCTPCHLASDHWRVNTSKKYRLVVNDTLLHCDVACQAGVLTWNFSNLSNPSIPSHFTDLGFALFVCSRHWLQTFCHIYAVITLLMWIAVFWIIYVQYMRVWTKSVRLNDDCSIVEDRKGNTAVIATATASHWPVMNTNPNRTNPIAKLGYY